MKLIKIAAMMICALMLFSCAPASPGVDHDADENGKTVTAAVNWEFLTIR